MRKLNTLKFARADYKASKHCRYAMLQNGAQMDEKDAQVNVGGPHLGLLKNAYCNMKVCNLCILCLPALKHGVT